MPRPDRNAAAPVAIPPALMHAVRRHFVLVDLWLFGSRARGDHRPDSDWDIFVVVPDDRVDLTDPYVGWLVRRDALDAGIEATFVAATASDVASSWGVVNTLANALAREGVRVRVE